MRYIYYISYIINTIFKFVIIIYYILEHHVLYIKL